MSNKTFDCFENKQLRQLKESILTIGLWQKKYIYKLHKKPKKYTILHNNPVTFRMILQMKRTAFGENCPKL